MKICIGIDPGKSGGISVIWEDGIVRCEAWDDSDFISVINLVNRHATSNNILIACCVEKVGAMPGQGVTSMFSFGKSAGFIEGALRASKIPYQLVTPQTWKKEFGLNASKQKSIDVCHRLFPDVNLKRTDRCKTDHDGMAESLLMAEYARRKL